MTEENPAVEETVLTPDSIQNKADILETNLFKDMKVYDEDTRAVIHVERKNTLNAVVEKAVFQLLFRLSIHPSVMQDDFRQALLATADPKAPPVTFKRHVQGTFMDQGDREIEITVKPGQIDVEIQGLKPIPKQDEDIVKIYFEHQTHPGKLLANGKFDFRELHKFPSVKTGENLLLIRYPVSGKPGISYEGKVIPVTEPQSLDLTYKDGVIKKEYYDKNGHLLGYFLTAAKTGVVLLAKTGNTIREIDVSDQIELETIDFSIGNIGTEFISPVSMKIGTINDGFRIRAHGIVEVGCLDGGSVSTDMHAEIDQVRPNSHVEAVENITVRTVVDSELVSQQGQIIVKDEMRDAKIKAANVIFNTKKGIMLNTRVEACRLEFQNVYYCGSNKIYLGTDLFKRRLEIMDSLEKVEKGNQDVQEAMNYIKSKLLAGLKNLAGQISDDMILNMFKLLIHSLQTLTFSDSFKVLENLREKLNVLQVDQLKKTFLELEKQAKTIQDFEEKKNELNQERQKIENQINSIRFELKGKINPTGTIQIYCSKKPSDDPVYEVKPVQKDTNESISCTGAYHLDGGFQTY